MNTPNCRLSNTMSSRAIISNNLLSLFSPSTFLAICIIVASIFFTAGCGGKKSPIEDIKHPNSEITARSLRQNVYPCVEILFSQTATSIEYEDFIINSKGKKKKVKTDVINLSKDDYIYREIVYLIEFQSRKNYKVSYTKHYPSTIKAEFVSSEALSERYRGFSILYEIEQHPKQISARSGIVTVVEAADGVYIRGVVQDVYTSDDDADSIKGTLIVDRLIHSGKQSHLFLAESWRESSVGKLYIEDMKRDLHWYNENINSISCIK